MDNINMYDFIISNPDFEVAMQTIYLALYVLKPGGYLIILLPSDFFEASPARTRVYKVLNCTIIKEYKLGHLGYYEDNRDMQKLSTDSIFLMKRCRRDKYNYEVINSRLAGMLQT